MNCYFTCQNYQISLKRALLRRKKLHWPRLIPTRYNGSFNAQSICMRFIGLIELGRRLESRIISSARLKCDVVSHKTARHANRRIMIVATPRWPGNSAPCLASNVNQEDWREPYTAVGVANAPSAEGLGGLSTGAGVCIQTLLVEKHAPEIAGSRCVTVCKKF